MHSGLVNFGGIEEFISKLDLGIVEKFIIKVAEMRRVDTSYN